MKTAKHNANDYEDEKIAHLVGFDSFISIELLFVQLAPEIENVSENSFPNSFWSLDLGF
jgi:hypothetical protein